MDGRVWSAYLAMGDSVTEGVGDDVGDLPCRSWADWLADGLTEAEPGMRYRNVASKGATSSTVLREQAPEIAKWRPRLVSVTVGANDAREPAWTPEAFESELSAILVAAREAGADVLTGTYPDIGRTLVETGRRVRDSWRPYFERMHEVNRVIRDVALRHDACLLDMESVGAGDAKYLSRDFTHPNALAYLLTGQMALAALAVRFDLPALAQDDVSFG